MNTDDGTTLPQERDPLDEIIREVAIRHGIGVGRDDPILMTYTINRKVMEATAGIQRAILSEHLAGLKTLSRELRDEAAGRLDLTLREATQSMRLALEQEAKRLFSQQRMEGEALHREMMEECLRSQRFAGASLLVSLLALAAATALLWHAG